MNAPRTTHSLISAAMLAIAASSLAFAQPKDGSATAAKETGAATVPNTNTNPVKHRYWRHQGGRHPHYGSRRVGT